jgi:hypothetical protein
LNKAYHVNDPSEELGYTDLIAIELATILEQNSGWMMGTPYVSEEGMEEMADLFDEVPIPLKGIVYNKFLTEVESRGIEYSRDMFSRPN